jgi:hypothetical protein
MREARPPAGLAGGYRCRHCLASGVTALRVYRVSRTLQKLSHDLIYVYALSYKRTYSIVSNVMCMVSC